MMEMFPRGRGVSDNVDCGIIKYGRNILLARRMGSSGVPDREKWRPDLAAVAAAIQFVKDAGRLEEEAQERAQGI